MPATLAGLGQIDHQRDGFATELGTDACERLLWRVDQHDAGAGGSIDLAHSRPMPDAAPVDRRNFSREILTLFASIGFLWFRRGRGKPANGVQRVGR